MMLALLFSLAAAGQSASAAAPSDDLAGRIAGRLAPADVVAITINDGGDARSEELRDAISRAIRARGITIADATQATTHIDVSCGGNLREHACLAELRRASGSEIIAATTPRLITESADAAGLMSLEIRPVFAQRDPILDVAVAANRLFVLQPDALVSYERGDAGWRRVQSRPIPQARVWPRDLRGRVWLDGEAIDVRLPGMACRAAANAGTLACADENQPWPIALDNSGIDATRNYFTTREGLPFFGAAAVDSGSNPRWLVADLSGSLALLDSTRRVTATVGSADDVVAVGAACVSAPHVLVSTASSRQPNSDTLRLLRLAGQRTIASSSPLEIAGAVTALWSDRTASTATAVVRDPSGERYEALHIAIACDR